MFDENRLLAFVRTLYWREKDSCGTCAEYYGYGCSHPDNCEWHWDYAKDLKKFEIPKETNYKKSSPKMKKMQKKYAALDKQQSDAEKRQRGRRREQDNKAGERPRQKNYSI